MARRNNYLVALGGLFIALEVVLGKWLAIDLTFVRISFVFVPVALGGIVFGPFWNGLLYAAADIVGVLMFPSSMSFHPGFTLNAFLSGCAYGFFLNDASPARAIFPGLFGSAPQSGFPLPSGLRRLSGLLRFSGLSRSSGPLRQSRFPRPSVSTPVFLARMTLAAFCVTILINTLLNSYWVAALLGKAYTVYLWPRLIKSLILLPVQVAVVGVLWRYLGRYVESSIFPKLRST